MGATLAAGPAESRTALRRTALALSATESALTRPTLRRSAEAGAATGSALAHGGRGHHGADDLADLLALLIA